MEKKLLTIIGVLQELSDSYAKADTSDSITFEELYNDYLKSIAGKGSPRAYANKVRLSKHILADIGSHSLVDLTFDFMSQYINSWTTRLYIRGKKENLYSQSHIDKVYNNLHCVLRYGVQTGKLYKNVIDCISCPISRKFEEESEKALNEWEIQKVLGLCPINNSSIDMETAYWYTMKILLLYTGVRPGEVLAFKFTDFDFVAGTVKILRSLSLNVNVDIDDKIQLKSSHPYIKLLKNEINGKNDYARRVLKIGDFALSVVLWYKNLIDSDHELLRRRRQHKTSSFLFAWYADGMLKRPDYYGNAWRQHLISMNIDPSQYNMYRFRHTFCTRLFKIHKLDPKTVQRLMGDNSMDMVIRVYHSLNKDDLLIASGDYSKELDSVVFGTA